MVLPRLWLFLSLYGKYNLSRVVSIPDPGLEIGVPERSEERVGSAGGA